MWRAIGRSVRGASHRRGRIPNQDAIAWVPASGTGSPLILGVADGHGAQASFRSDTGSALAVEVATALLGEFLEQEAGAGLGQLASAVRSIPRELIARWRRAVDDHAGKNPIPVNGARGDIAIAYGSTILAAAVTEEFVVLLQLGDGDILLVSADGEVRRPWPRDGRYLGGETPSLCSEDAWTQVRVDIQAFAPEAHQLILLCTDGYANSFREDDGFLRTGRDILEIIQQEGIGRVEQDLEDWLWEASELGSGDDITSGLLWRAPAVGSANGV
jgi:serine/threonine protein phosphatase PrpC